MSKIKYDKYRKEKQKAYGKCLPTKALNEFSLTPQAQEIWDTIPGDFQMKLLNNVWCKTCSDTTGIGSVSGKVEKELERKNYEF